MGSGFLGGTAGPRAVVLGLAVCLSGPAPAMSQISPPPAEAPERAPFADLAAALELDRLIDIMRAEGIAYGDTIARDLFGGAAPAGWQERVSDIYAADRMTASVAAALSDAVAGDDVAAMTAFLTQGPGARAVSFEIAAREARLDPDVERAADDAAALAVADDDPRIDLIDSYIAANDLIERNVADAMTSNYAFYIGLMDGGAMPGGVTEAEILADVWGQEVLIRQNLTDWHYSFLFMAFAPLEDAEIEAYTAFSRTVAGRQLNDALFAAFDDVFTQISRDLGQAAADFLVTQDL